MTDPETKQREQRALEDGMKEAQMEGSIITLESFLKEGVVLPD